MDPTTYKRNLETETAIGAWGTACTALFFLISAFVEFFTGLAWLSEVGCLIGIVTITVILVQSHISSVSTRTREEFALGMSSVSDTAPLANRTSRGARTGENIVTEPKIRGLKARERRLDDAAVAKGFIISKARSEKQDGRYIIVGQPVKMIMSSHNAAFPYSFSLEEAEAYLSRSTT
jgi:hypothetical protein